MGAPQRHKDAAQMPDEFSAALRVRTGEVNDTRRIVCFLYLVMRDRLPVGTVAEAHRRLLEEDAKDTGRVTPWILESEEHTPNVARVYPVVTVTFRQYAFLSRVFEEVADLEEILAQLSPADDVECAFTNGYLARYAQLIADDLSNGSTQEEDEAIAHR